jgi:hypothetical protein
VSTLVVQTARFAVASTENNPRDHLEIEWDERALVKVAREGDRNPVLAFRQGERGGVGR